MWSNFSRIRAGSPNWSARELVQANGHQMIAVYVPATCGNLSVVRRAIPVIAQHAPPKRVLAAAPVPAAVAETEFSPAPAAVKRGINFLPLLFGLAALVGATSGGSGGGASLPPIDACP
jgi:hypothetical protein